VAVKPFESINDLLDKYLTPAFEKRGDPVIDWNKPALRFRISGPINEAGENSQLGQVINMVDPNEPF
jgi:hypothetical protein